MTRYAFVMGSNGPSEFGELKYAIKDADRISSVLAGRRCGFEVARVENINDVFDLRRQLYLCASSCAPQDTFLCYFSGHGVLDQGELFLVWDNTNTNLAATALPVADVLSALKRCKASNKLLILDCCHAGGATGYRNAVGVPIEELQIKDANHFVLMASDRLERARELEELEGSFLTSKIREALDNKFYDADKDGDQRISIQDLITWLEECTAWHNSQSAHKVPQPYLFGQKKGNFFLTQDESTWTPYEIPWPDGSTIVVLPIAPILEIPIRTEEPIEFALCISKNLITNAQYKASLADKKHSSKSPEGENFQHDLKQWTGPFYPWDDPSFNDPDKPVVCISFDDAVRYCNWVQKLVNEWDLGTQSLFSKVQGIVKRPESNIVIDIPPYRLWDFAAFGTEYPTPSPQLWLSQTKEIHHKEPSPATVDITGTRTNKRGIADMIGNVWEWCGEDDWLFHNEEREKRESLYRPAFLADSHISDRSPLLGINRRPSKWEYHRDSWRARLRGGGFLDDLMKLEEPFLRATELKDGANTRHSDLGFRIAAQLPVDYLPDHVQIQLRMCKAVNAYRFSDFEPPIIIQGSE